MSAEIPSFPGNVFPGNPEFPPKSRDLRFRGLWISAHILISAESMISSDFTLCCHDAQTADSATVKNEKRKLKKKKKCAPLDPSKSVDHAPRGKARRSSGHGKGNWDPAPPFFSVKSGSPVVNLSAVPALCADDGPAACSHAPDPFRCSVQSARTSSLASSFVWSADRCVMRNPHPRRGILDVPQAASLPSSPWATSVGLAPDDNCSRKPLQNTSEQGPAAPSVEAENKLL